LKDNQVKIQAITMVILFIMLTAVFIGMRVWFGVIDAIIACGILLAFFLITKAFWRRRGNSKLRFYSMIFSSIVAFISPLFIKAGVYKSILIVALFELMQKQFNVLSEIEIEGVLKPLTFFEMMFIIVLILGAIYLLTRDKSVLGNHIDSLDKEFSQNDLKDLKSFLEMLEFDLKQMDSKTRWHDSYYTPLEAEVEVLSTRSKRKKVSKMVKALRRNRKNDIFLIIGEPGAGKSVSLRKLAKDLLKEVEKTGKIPIYINLKHWKFEKAWTEKDKPTATELYNFIERDLKNRLNNIFTTRFMDENFRKLHDSGRLFYIFDSFDEIPAVLDADENSEIIDHLSKEIELFLYPLNGTRGVLASREFKCPTNRYRAQTVYYIRNFSEEKIKCALESSLRSKGVDVSKKLVRNRYLMQIAKNPFLLALIANYAEENNYELPRTQSDLYINYIDNRLRMCSESLKKRKMTIQKVIEMAIEISFYMMNEKDFGLEIPSEILEQRFPNEDIKSILDILVHAKLGRIGETEEKRFSFVHRRFNEYFVVEKLMKNSGIVRSVFKETILEDKRWRDPLVLYCEVTDNDVVMDIAQFCWNEIKILGENIDSTSQNYLEAIRCLRFLTDAYKNKRQYIEEFYWELYLLVKEVVSGDADVLTKKLFIEALGILNDDEIDEIITIALGIKNNWIRDNAFISCRHLPQISEKLESKLKEYIFSVSEYELIKNRKSLLFSLGLTDAFLSIKRLCQLRLLDSYVCVIIFIILSIVAPEIQVIFMMILVFSFLILKIGRLIAQEFYKLIDYFNEKYSIEDLKFKIDELKSIEFSAYDFKSLRLFSSLVLILTIIMLLFTSNEGKDIVMDAFLFKMNELFIISEYMKGMIVVVVLLSIFIFGSILNLIYYMKKIVKGIRISSRGVLIGGLTIVISFLVAMFGELFEKYLYIANGIIYVLVGLLALAFLSSIIKRIVDKIMLSKLNVANRIQRAEVELTLKRFKTNYGRMEYLEKIQKLSVTVNGQWENNDILSIYKDDCGTLLCKLEEQWLGLSK